MKNNLKIIAKIFGCFNFFLYLCTIIQEWIIKAGRTTRCSWSDKFLIP